MAKIIAVVSLLWSVPGLGSLQPNIELETVTYRLRLSNPSAVPLPTLGDLALQEVHFSDSHGSVVEHREWNLTWVHVDGDSPDKQENGSNDLASEWHLVLDKTSTEHQTLNSHFRKLNGKGRISDDEEPTFIFKHASGCGPVQLLTVKVASVYLLRGRAPELLGHVSSLLGEESAHLPSTSPLSSRVMLSRELPAKSFRMPFGKTKSSGSASSPSSPRGARVRVWEWFHKSSSAPVPRKNAVKPLRTPSLPDTQKWRQASPRQNTPRDGSS